MMRNLKSGVNLVVLSSLLLYSNFVFAAKDKCAEAAAHLANAAIPSSVTQTKQIENLRAAGFVQVNQSHYYRRGGFLIHAQQDGSLKVFLSASSDLASSKAKLVGLDVTRDPEFEDKLTLVVNDGGRYERVNSIRGSSRGYGGDAPANIRHIARLSGRDQLIRAGFIQDPDVPSLFRIDINSKHGRKPVSIMAVLDGDKIVQILTPASEAIEQRVNAGTEIGGFRLLTDGDKPGMSALRFRRNFIEFEVSDSYEGGRFVTGAQKVLRDLADISDQELRWDLPQVQTQEGDHFIGGFNVSAWERTKPKDFFADKGKEEAPSLAKLKGRLNPGKSSGAGFLGEREKFEDVLAADHKHVTEDLKLTHQALAEPLLKMMAAHYFGFPDEFTYMGYRYKWSEVGWMGSQFSPFNDGTSASHDITLTNLDSGATLTFSALVPHMIYRYGFYEGKGTSYRVEPDAILNLLPFLKDGKRKEGSATSVASGEKVSGLNFTERRALYQGMKIQSEGSKVNVVVEYEGGKTTTQGFRNFDEVFVYNGGGMGLKLEEPIGVDSRDTAYVVTREVDPAIERGPNGETILVLSKPEVNGIGGWNAGKPKTVRVVLSKEVAPVHFDLDALTRGDRDKTVENFAAFLGRTYANPSKPIFMNLYGQKNSLSEPARVQQIAYENGEIKFSVSIPGLPTSVIRATVDQIIPHEKETEVILKVQNPELNAWGGSDVRLNFAIDVGHGIFAR